MDDASCGVLVFTKSPVPGRVKSRLIGELGAAGAARLYRELVRRTLLTATRSGAGPVEIWCSPGTRHGFIRQCAREFNARLYRQRGDSLGTRMEFALHQALERFGAALLVGCDCPGLSAADLRDATRLLHRGTDLVLGPAEDGGFYLVGLRAPCPGLFNGVPWGGARVLAASLANAGKLGLSVRKISTRWDLDRPRDLHRYRGTR